MKDFFKKAKNWFISFYKSIEPGPIAVKGASRAIATTVTLIWLMASIAFFVIAPGTWFGVVPVILLPPLALLMGGLTILSIKLIKRIPKPLVWVIPGGYLILSIIYSQGDLSWQFPLVVFISAGAAGAGLFTLTKKSRAQNTLKHTIVAISGSAIGLAGLIWGIVWFLNTGFEPDPKLNNAHLAADFKPSHLDLPNPSEKGNYQVQYLTYGSGKDQHRMEYGEDVTIVTDSVDGSRLIDNWEGITGKLRTWYWGFDDEALPINARVWYPEGEGPFPLALIVHGNHSMFDYSDPGYEYLGELLASHGIIMASVDENFINSGWTDVFGEGLDEENDARGWLLLKHLQEWRKWNSDSESLFYNKVDMDNIAVMGHSRGGEAAAIAGFFNSLDYYPDDAKETFDFDFNIKSVVAIAPVDGQYKPASVGTPLKDVNYLVIHGSNDGDVQSFAGLRQYERLEFSDSTDYFKSAVYVYGANHGQFNTSWGNTDSPQPWASLLNLDALMPMEDQLTIGKVMINAFLQSTLADQKGYQEFFKDYRKGIDWLPENIYLNQYEASEWGIIADFDEDLDLVTAGSEASIDTEHLTVWKEDLVGMKWGNKATRAVFIGWDSTAHPLDTAKYKITFKDTKDLEETPWFTFEMAQSKLNSYPDKKRDEEKRKALENDNNNDKEEEEETESEEEKDEDEEIDDKEEKEEEDKEQAPDPINISLAIYDDQGEMVKFDLHSFALLQPQISVDIYKNKSLQTNKTSEAVYQTFFFDLNSIADQNSAFDKKALSHIEFIFDQEKNGVIILDKLSLHQQ